MARLNYCYYYILTIVTDVIVKVTFCTCMWRLWRTRNTTLPAPRVVSTSICKSACLILGYMLSGRVKQYYTDYYYYTLLTQCMRTYLIRSSFEEFNPKPAQQNHLSHSLIDLLSQVNMAVIYFVLHTADYLVELCYCTADLGYI